MGTVGRVQWYGAVGTVVRCKGYSGTVQRVQWYSAEGTVVECRGMQGDAGGTVVQEGDCGSTVKGCSIQTLGDKLKWVYKINFGTSNIPSTILSQTTA